MILTAVLSLALRNLPDATEQGLLALSGAFWQDDGEFDGYGQDNVDRLVAAELERLGRAARRERVRLQFVEWGNEYVWL